ncbi:MAG TPA: saccharopine dehydrogenase NADP-binding domain-containing protein [Acidisphaera sp.]|nr:saccharopine dehydrogenase NADP-binding domain-containing protein [Acidisphaera sp.]
MSLTAWETAMREGFMVYGATGYTGRLIARAAKAAGMAPLLAGRDADRLGRVARELGLKSRAISLSDTSALRQALSEVTVVLHAAGPFSRTSAPMLDACLASGTHYLDITGEIPVFEAAAARDAAAKRAGVMVLPGVGFDVVPSDCLAAHLHERLPDATELSLAIAALSTMSRGTQKTALEGVAGGMQQVRRGGRITTLAAPLARDFDFGDGPRRCLSVGWGDVATAFHSTGIPDITVYIRASRQIEQMVRVGAPALWLIGLAPVQALLRGLIDWLPAGPSEAQRATGRAVLVGEARNAAGERVTARVVTPETYELTIRSAVEIVRRVLDGGAKPGFQTPSLAFGSGLIAAIPGCTLTDLPS